MPPYLPPGFRFKPSDLELIKDYLLPKVLGEQLPSDAVIEGEVYGDNAQLPEGNDSVGEQYFFVKRKKNQKGTKTIRLAGDGYWKVTGNKKKIHEKRRNHICTKRSLVFKGKSNSRRKKNLLMDEYSLTRSMIQNNSEDWVLCRIKRSNRSTEKSNSQEEEEEEEEGDDLTSIDLDDNCKQIEDNHMQQYPVEIAEGHSPASVEIDDTSSVLVIDDTKSVDIDDFWKSIQDNNIKECPVETAGEACYYLCTGQLMTMLSSPTVIPTEPQALVGIDYNMENQADLAYSNMINENFFNNNYYND
ncbi:hypothetical protein MRB53_029152 [Persea americana]|uniref:Uncharacterized protein n=1 Tax=Persea americana TaxID=3435 RepID=A0ACC2KI93_PERAE|nr:hypothetical protein MRB53_029152 [Persea americana]